MQHADRLKVIQHGAIVLFVGLLCGFAVVPEEEPMRLWHTAHESLIMLGILMITVSSVFPHLRIQPREAKGLVVSSLATGYGLMVGLLIQAFTGEHAFGPSRSPVLMTGFIGNAIGIGGSMIMMLLVIAGAHAARSAKAVEGVPVST